MTAKTILIFAAAGAALALSACERPHLRHHHEAADAATPLKAVTQLDCPAVQGDLSRRSAAPDGKSCVYDGDLGTQVTLQLVDLKGGDVNAALDPIAAQLRAELPAKVDTPPKDSDEHDRVDIDLPGVSIHAGGDGKARIQAGKADKGVTIDANDQGAEVHIEDSHGPGVRKMLILASETPGPNGYRVTGYEARGPEGGPIVVALVRAKTDDHDEVFHDVRGLIRHNVGG
ncbi:MAG TPA: hypothetical protein VG939_19115 [Caulobacteraceae bacterium]|nr:hypothetical protein [Caulobacteraceae bacterium]